ncbi:MAG TPA: PAS domain-containing protein [Stellaceae bacterium]|nr:PAS domain-containing protein [Stellaceae bacterium]
MLDSIITDRLQPVARELLAAWAALPRRDGVPMRSDFDPISVRRILPVVCLVERVKEGDWRMRLAGTEIERRWGKPLTGLSYTDIMAPAAARSTLCEFDAMCAQPCGSWSLRHLELSSGRHLDAETLRLPLRAADGCISLILACGGELTGRFLHEPDKCREVVTVLEQQFLDIGAGIPEWICAPWPTGGPYKMKVS